jgi:hypothetical protein
MIGLLCLFLALLASPFKSKIRLQAENAVLRHQLNVLRRKVQGRVRLTNNNRWFLTQLYRWFPSILQVLTIVQPETLVRWHRAGFRCYWRWKSRPRGGRPANQRLIIKSNYSGQKNHLARLRKCRRSLRSAVQQAREQGTCSASSMRPPQ